MTSTKFTPGPWEYNNSSGDVEASGEIITLPRKEANAHLIAAAPELYAALVDARRELSSIDAEGGMGDYTEQLAEIEAILAKARGEWSADDILKREG